MIEWHIELRKISDLKINPKNPRRLTKDQADHLKTSLEKFGIAEKPIINSDGTIIGGHQRLKTLKKMKVKEVECWVPDRMLDEKEANEMNIRLNKNTGEWDWDVLANEWEALDLIEWGFTESDLVGIVEEQEGLEKEPEDEKKQQLQKCPECGHEFKKTK